MKLNVEQYLKISLFLEESQLDLLKIGHSFQIVLGKATTQLCAVHQDLDHILAFL